MHGWRRELGTIAEGATTALALTTLVLLLVSQSPAVLPPVPHIMPQQHQLQVLLVQQVAPLPLRVPQAPPHALRPRRRHCQQDDGDGDDGGYDYHCMDYHFHDYPHRVVNPMTHARRLSTGSRVPCA